MADASFVQDSFLGGEWSPFAQGRITDKRYRTAMETCLNGLPVEEGAWVRRPGTAHLATTRNGAYGRTLPFDFTDVAPFTMEHTQNHLRMFAGRSLVFDSVATVADISSDNPAVVSVSGAEGWVTGDQVMFLFQSAATVADGAILRNRVLKITVLNAEQFTLADPITNVVVNGADVMWDPTQVSAQVARVLDLPTPYLAADIPTVRRIQAAGVGAARSNVGIILNPKYQPRIVTAVASATAPTFSTFTISPLAFVDGPYNAAPSGATLTPSGTVGAFNVQINYGAWSVTYSYQIGDFASFGGNAYQSRTEGNLGNQPDISPTQWAVVSAGAAVGTNGFQAGDVGRLIRLLSEPSAWSSGAAYVAGNAVKYNSAYYVAQAASTGAAPDVNLSAWLPTTSTAVAQWVWGRLSAINSTSNAQVVLLGTQQTLLYNLPITIWRIGAYSDAAGWPACGAYYDSRLWLGGVAPNEFFASVSNDIFDMAPTAPDGTVGDANAISETFNSDEQNTLYWMEPTASGLLCGTKKGEWLIAASSLKDPITPTSIQIDRVTKVGVANIQPAHTPLTMIVVQRFTRLLYEIFPDLFSGKLTAPNLNVYSKHLTTSGVAEVAYQSELAPIVWARNTDGSLVGWTYSRRSAQSTVEPDIVGGHRHTLGSGRTVVSLSVNATPSQTSDSPILVTKDALGVHHVEQMTRVLDPADPVTSAWFVDDATTPSGMQVNANNVTFYGLWHLNGKTISVSCGGLDCGDYVVANGSVTVPFGSDPGKFFTAAYLTSLNGGSYGDLAVAAESTVTVQPGTNIQPSQIDEFVVPNSPVSGALANGVLKIDYANNQAYGLGGDGIRKMSLTNFTQLSAATLASIAATGPGLTPDTAFDWCLGTDGMLYFASTTNNCSPWMKINPATWACIASFGTASAGWSGGPTGLGRSYSVVGVFAGANYIAGGFQISAFSREIAWMNVDTMQYVANSRFDIEAGFGLTCCAGPQTSLGGSIYGLSTAQSPNNTPDHTTLYQSSINGSTGVVTTVAVKQINATDIDPTWGNIVTIVGPVRDARDGQLLIGFTTSTPGVANASYMCKMRSGDGTFVWKTAMPASSGLPADGGLKASRSTGGVLSWLSNNLVTVFNTIIGTYVTYPVGLLPSGATISDDTAGRIIAHVNYASGLANAPRPGPGTPSSFNEWANLGLGDVLFGSTTSTSRITVPAVIGFTYTSRGRIVRPALPAEAGAANGPAPGKTRRNHMFSALLAAAIYGTISFGTVFGKLRPANFKQANNQPYDTKTLYSGVHWSTLEDNYDFEGGLAWEVTRPVPASISSVSGFINTQDR